MSNIKDRAKFEKLDNTIWKKSKIDKKGQTTLPLKLRKKLHLCGGGQILWICVNRKNGKSNEFLIDVGIKNKEEVKK